MHSEKLVVLVRAEEAIFRKGELQPHEDSRDTTQQEKNEGCDDEARSYAGVMNLREPANEARGFAPCALQTLMSGDTRRRRNDWFTDGQGSAPIASLASK